MYTKQLLCFIYSRRTTQSLSQAQMVCPWEADLTWYSLVLALEACALTSAPLSYWSACLLLFPLATVVYLGYYVKYKTQ